MRDYRDYRDKYLGACQHGGDIYRNQGISLDFSVNTGPLGMPGSVVKAVLQAAEKCAHYPDSRCGRLREKIAGLHGLDSSRIVCGNGAADLIYSLALALGPRRALIPAPTFSEYEAALAAAGSQVSYYDLEEEKQFALDEGLTDRLADDVDLLFICNPNNPTGVLTKRDQMEKILGICKEHNIFLVVDECFMDFVMGGASHSLLSFTGGYPNLFVLKAFTKIFSMAGLRLGYGICSNQEVLLGIDRVRQPWSVSIPAQEAGIVAAEELEFMEMTRRLVEKERGYLEMELKRIGYLVYPSSANYLLFYDPSRRRLKEELIKHGILIRSCANYRGLGEGYYRVCVKTHEENEKLMEALRLLVG